ncbi:MAG: sulfotransferase domain-containing protein [Pseudobdellovibrionaceae bacterium]
MAKQEIDKNIVMCLTTGRSGTNLLEKLLGLAEDTHAVHEPVPEFHKVLPEVRKNPQAAIDFVRDHKLPAILAVKEKNYVETSHLFGKGFYEAFLELGIPFSLIILNRDPREVAQSFWRIKSIPRRKRYGREFMFDPAQSGVIKMKNWRFKSDYQLCYWYALEVERRKSLYKAECEKRGIPVFEIDITELKDWDKFQALCKTCALSLPEGTQEKFEAVSETKVNLKTKHKPRRNFRSFDAQEEGVWKALGDAGKVLREEVVKRYQA